MQTVIVYERADGGCAVIRPSARAFAEAAASALAQPEPVELSEAEFCGALAAELVPSGRPHVVVEAASLPTVAQESWSIDDDIVIDTTALKATLAAYAADKRWRIETGGIVRNGSWLPTAREARSAMKDAYDMLVAGKLLDAEGEVRTTIDVTIGTTALVGLTAEQVDGMLVVIAQHVQAAFTVGAAVLAGINAGTISTISEIEAAEWPSNT